MADFEILLGMGPDKRVSERLGEMLEWLKRHAWKACKRQKCFRGSNPRLSAKILRQYEVPTSMKRKNEILTVYI